MQCLLSQGLKITVLLFTEMIKYMQIKNASENANY